MNKSVRVDLGPLAPLVSGLRWQQIRRLKLRAESDPQGAAHEWGALMSRWRPWARVRLMRVSGRHEGRG